MLQVQTVPFLSYLTETYIFCNSYSRVQLKLMIIYFLFNPQGLRLYDASLHRPPHPSKLKINKPYNPVIGLLGIYPKRRTLIRKDLCTPMFTAALFTISKIWKQPRYVLTDEWIKKIWYPYIILSSNRKKNEILLFVSTWMDLESIMLNKISQPEKYKCHMILFIIGI